MIINGKVSGNVFSAGSSVTVNGEVGHDVFAAAAAVTIGPDARIKYNAYIAGASVESRRGSQIGSSLLRGNVRGTLRQDPRSDIE